MWCLHKAYQFLCLVLFFLNFHANISSATSSSITQLCSQDEAAALIQFKSSLSTDSYNSDSWRCNESGIKSYPKTDSWKEGTDCCSWDGVTCDDIKGHVIDLDLSCSWLYGTFPSNSTLFHLLHLQKLNLACNNFKFSKMSSKFGEFASLLYLNLSRSLFAGRVPSHVSHLSKLILLDLSAWDDDQFLTLDNHTLEGIIHNLTEVRQLFLDGINMSSVNPTVLMNLSSSLRSLSLKDCDLQGKFPKNIFHLPNLKMLNLAHNVNLNLNLAKLNQSSHLKILDLSDTFFSKEFFDLIGNLVSLEQLDVSGATFSERELPSSIGNCISLKRLDLSYSWLSGSIPRSMGNLSQLNYLDLSLNSFSGHIPSALTSLRQLQFLSIQENLLEGSIPDEVNSFPNLISIHLSSNSLNGTLPSWLYTISSLKYLYLSNNLFSGHIKEFQYSSLTEIELQGNKLQGPIPYSISQLLNLAFLDLSSNSLQGPIPYSISQLLNLAVLDLSSNSLQGPIPYSISQLPNLAFLDLSSNSLQGSIPDELRSFPNLILLDLSDNLLTGTLPSWLNTISSLQYIYLSNNLFSGHIKEFQYISLTEMELKNNKLQGPIPSSISQLQNLSFLDLSSNYLSGIVEFGMFSKLQNLQFLDLSYNNLSLNSNGTSADYTLPNLQFLHLSSCNVREFPQFLRGSKDLERLDLSDNGIYGKIPRWMLDVGKDSLYYLNLSHNSLTYIEQLPWKGIQFLDLSSNLIHGDLPIPPMETNVFFISNNSFSGEISSLICKVSSLAYLDMSHNNLSGTIPQCFGNLSQSLLMLNLRMNKFHGIVPPTFTEGCGLMNLDLNDNQLEGPLTRSILNCTSLEVLDLGHNKINDTFPYWLGSLRQLQVLVLRSNQLQGSIQDTSCNLSFSKVQIFDLSGNYFTGTLPVRYIQNFKAMINLKKNETEMPYMGVIDYLRGPFYSYSLQIEIKGVEREMEKIFTMLTSVDLSNNKFQGEIPEVIGKLNSLKGLNLSHNNLNGSIPASIGNLINLEWLDLSSNKLTGMIPKQLLDVASLSVFNVSENQLEGQIPQGKQFNTFGNDSYEGNKGLCGFPVSKGCSNSEPPPSNFPEEVGSKSNIAFGWKVVLIGYGCGVVFGVAMGYVVFQTGKPKWFVTLVEDRHHRRRKTSKIGNRSHCGTRI